MRQIYSRIIINKGKTLSNMIMFFLCFIILFSSIVINNLNVEIEDYLYKKLGINLIVYGDINDSYLGYEDTYDTYNDVYKKMHEIKDYIEQENLGRVYLEEVMCNLNLYCAKDLYNEDDYRMALFDYPSIEGNYLSVVSKDIDSNAHYKTAMKNFYLDPHSVEEPINYSYSSGMHPVLVGVDRKDFSDIKSKYINIVAGRTFTDEEIDDGKNVVICGPYTYILSRNELRAVKLGDIIPLSIEYGDDVISYDFEIIGIDDGYSGGLAVENTMIMEKEGIVHMLGNSYLTTLFIPQKAYLRIRDDLLEMYDEYGRPYASVDDLASDEPIFYNQYGAIRPMLIEADNLDDYQNIVFYINGELNKLNKISDRVIEYTYFSNLDRFYAVINNISTVEGLLKLAIVISVCAFLVVFILYVLKTIEQDKKELALYMALGKKKVEVVFGLFIEYLIKSIIPMILSLVLTSVLANTYLNHMNNNLITTDNIFYSGELDTLEINIGLSNYLVPIFVVLVIMILVCAISYIRISKLNVKKILFED